MHEQFYPVSEEHRITVTLKQNNIEYSHQHLKYKLFIRINDTNCIQKIGDHKCSSP